MAERVGEFAGTRREFPFGLGRQVTACPARECVRLVVADVGDGQVRIDGGLAMVSDTGRLLR